MTGLLVFQKSKKVTMIIFNISDACVETFKLEGRVYKHNSSSFTLDHMK